MKFLRRTSGFAANGMVTGVATLVSIALIVRFFGETGWSTFAVAQAAGMLIAVLVGFGWPVLGPATVAMLSPAEQCEELLTSARIRLGVLAGLSLVCCLVLLPGFFPRSAEHLPVTIAYASTGLSSLWYFVGTGESWASFFREAVPRAIASLVAPIVALAGPTQLVIGAVILSGNLTSFLLVIHHARKSRPRPENAPGRSREGLKAVVVRQWHGLLTGGVSSVYMTLPTIAVSLFAAPAVGRFALGDKMVRLTSTALLPLTQVLQGWVPAGSSMAERKARVRRALTTMAVVGGSVGSLIAALGPIAGQIYSSGHISFDHALSVPMGAALACTLISQVAGVGCLGAFNDFRAVSSSAIIGASVGLPLLVIATILAGSVGAMWSIAISEACVLGYQILRLRSHLRRA